MKKPLLAITLGDPAGVGPETIASAWDEPALHACCRPLVVGHPDVLRRAVALVGGLQHVAEIASPDQAVPTAGLIPCLPCGSAAAARVKPAVADPRGGQAAYDAIVLAAELALAGEVDGIVTAPLNKAALAAAGCRHPGHTELLAELCGVREAAMMLYLPPGPRVASAGGLGVAHATLHTPLRRVFDELTSERIVQCARMAASLMGGFLDQSLAAAPRIGVCALNPHAGEEGLFGNEEFDVIRPAVEQLQSAGYSAVGPLPADTLFARAAAGEFDAVVAMYHDQGHIALKLLDMPRAVNITLGLPIVRTSVAHGTAFDLAWQGRADHRGMVEAVRVAAVLAVNRHRMLQSASQACS